VEAVDERRCRELIAHGTVARIALTLAGLPVIVPVTYTCTGEDVVFRIPDVQRIRAATNETIIAFEADVDGHSILLIGRCSPVSDEDNADGQCVRLHPEMITGHRTAA